MDADVFINGRKAKASSEVSVNDNVILHLGRHEIEFIVKEVRPTVKKEDAANMYEIIRDEIKERRENL